MEIHQFLPTLNVGDAIGNDAIEIQKVFVAAGYKSDIFVSSKNPLDKKCKHYSEYRSKPENILIFHYCMSSPIYNLINSVNEKCVIIYHNITPSHFFELYDTNLAINLANAREELKSYKNHVILAIGDSDYNAIELKRMGYRNVTTVPIILDFNKYTTQNQRLFMKYSEKYTNILFVGRVVPNKKHEDLIKLFYIYKKHINSKSNLFLVGTYSTEDVYYKKLKKLIHELSVTNVFFTGRVSDKDLTTYYALANIFVSMSEHEGFFVPILECMRMDIPILAFESTAIPYTLGNAGVMFKKKEFGMLAELINEVIKNRKNIILAQRERLKTFSPEKAGEQMLNVIEEMIDTSTKKWDDIYKFEKSSSPDIIPFQSKLCVQEDFGRPQYMYWCEKIKEKPKLHRKQWEFVFIAQALYERGLLKTGRKGLGFGVGTDPLVSLFASLGVSITASDMDSAEAKNKGWTKTNQHASNIAALYKKKICSKKDFQKVGFEVVDINNIPSKLKNYDFCWSACCLEHLGSIELGLEFIENSLNCLKHGGYAVHTTEFNLCSNDDTIDFENTVIFRRRDIEKVVHKLRLAGHLVEQIEYDSGKQLIDGYVDVPPYQSEPHLRIALGDFTTTSIGLIIRKNPN